MSGPHVAVEPHGPGRVLVRVTRRQSRAFARSPAEAAWLAGELARYLAGLPEAERAALYAPQKPAAAAPACRPAAPADRPGAARGRPPAARFVEPRSGAA